MNEHFENDYPLGEPCLVYQAFYSNDTMRWEHVGKPVTVAAQRFGERGTKSSSASSSSAVAAATMPLKRSQVCSGGEGVGERVSGGDGHRRRRRRRRGRGHHYCHQGGQIFNLHDPPTDRTANGRTDNPTQRPERFLGQRRFLSFMGKHFLDSGAPRPHNQLGAWL